ncbi:MAG TPA: TetR/AcrR family transcriptional regulator [Hellea balneolensis]|uniref:TetR/AcrR family transcriptional regulator n=1 Tax=Hellea balneolensis TaxID=287478 RepID=A0A7C5M0B3_9PROT|nr:TetR/AcrR family transcriptional regulator [Hellea balneolensis]
MARTATINDTDLLDKLSRVFRDYGYAGASLTMLAEACGLKKASLYHRFPGGKEQMASEVLAETKTWLTQNVLSILAQDIPAQDRILNMTQKLDQFYAHGRQACLLNMLSAARMEPGPFTNDIQRIFTAFIKALTQVLMDAGFDKTEAKRRAERTVAQLQGTLVLSRGTGSTKPFRDFLAYLPHEIFAS